VQGLTGGTATYAATDVNGALTFTKTDVPPGTLGDINVNFGISIGNGLTNNTGGAFTDAQVNAAAPSLQSYAVDPLGNVVLTLSNGDTVNAGQILLTDFSDPNALMMQGNNLYSNMEAAGPIGGSTSLSASGNAPGSNGLGSIQAGALEESNVDLSSEFANLITAQRSFQAGARLVTVSDTILEEVVNLKQH
jgi:flagellar hook protein FlgE